MNERPAGHAVRHRDAAIVAITMAAIMMFVAIGSAVAAAAFRGAAGHSGSPAHSLVVALILNVALILLALRCRRQLRADQRADAAPARPVAALMTRDERSGLLNRRGLNQAGAAMIAGHRGDGKTAILILAQLDLAEAALPDLIDNIVADIVRSAPTGALHARLDETLFAILFVADTTRAEAVDRAAERLIGRLAIPRTIEGRPAHLGVSVGIARADRDGASLDALTEAAGLALDAARDRGRNRYVWFDRALQHQRDTTAHIARELPGAIDQMQVNPRFVPQVELAGGTLCGFRVTYCWQHPRHGTLDAERLAPIAGRLALEDAMFFATAGQALQAARDWDPQITLAFDLSSALLSDTWLPQKIIKLLTEAGFPAHRLELAVAEDAVIGNLPLAQSIMGSLKNQGIHITFARFGAGQASLSCLRALPVDRIAIDPALVAAIDRDPEALSFATALTTLGSSLNMTVAAGGIATEQVGARLLAMGCTRGDGPAYGAALDVAQVRRLLAERRRLSVTNRRRAG